MMINELNITLPPFPGEWKGAKHMTEGQKKWLREYFPENTNKDILAAMPLKSERMMYYAVELLGLKKTREHLSRMGRRSNATEGLRESGRRCGSTYWQEVKEGKRLDPVSVLKQRDPERYAEWLREKSQTQRDIYASQRFRLKMGLPVRTNIRVALHPYTDGQTCRRYRALKFGYVLHEDCSEQGGHRFVIYYDENTTRHPQFERNCQKAGFSIRPWDE